MAKFVELTNNAGEKILVNLHAAVTIVPADKDGDSKTKTLIFFPSSKASVREHYAFIRKLLINSEF